MSEIYYIDGYNLLHSKPEWRDLADEDLEAAREAVVEAVNRWINDRGGRACVFFDGQGIRHERVAHDRGRPGIEVVFTSASLSADALIERGVYNAERRHNVIVVTADRGIRDFCLGLGALSMTPEHFIEGLAGPSSARPPSRPGATVGRFEEVLDDESARRLKELRERFDEPK